MEKILESKALARMFFSWFGTALILYGVIRWAVWPPADWQLLLKELMDKFATSLAIAVLLASFLFFVAPRVLKASQIDLVKNSDLDDLFKNQVQKSTFWLFQGATGRFVRSKVIPEFNSLCGKDRVAREVVAILLNPSNESACKAYAAYRAAIDPKGITAGSWTDERVAQEILATILVASRFASSLLTVNVYLVEMFSAFRADCTSEKVLITKEDPLASALVCDSGHEYFKHFMLDGQLHRNQGKHLALPIISPAESCTWRELKNFYLSMGLNPFPIIGASPPPNTVASLAPITFTATTSGAGVANSPTSAGGNTVSSSLVSSTSKEEAFFNKILEIAKERKSPYESA